MQVVHINAPLFTKHYNQVLAKGRWRSQSGKVIAGITAAWITAKATFRLSVWIPEISIGPHTVVGDFYGSSSVYSNSTRFCQSLLMKARCSSTSRDNEFWPIDSQQDPNAGDSRVAESRIRQYQNTISGTSGHRSSTPTVPFNSEVRLPISVLQWS